MPQHDRCSESHTLLFVIYTNYNYKNAIEFMHLFKLHTKGQANAENDTGIVFTSVYTHRTWDAQNNIHFCRILTMVY
jgi:hypothetical protein